MGIRGRFRRWLRAECGQSLVEFALMLPVLVFCLLGGTDIARAFATQLAVQNGARAAAEAAALERLLAPTEVRQDAIDEMNRTPGMNAANAIITTTYTQVDGLTPCTGQLDTTTPGTSTYATPCFVNVRVQYTFQTITPWPGLPRTFNFDRSTHFRKY